MFTRLTPYAPHMLSVLRIMSALLFVEHGMQKLFGFPSKTAITSMEIGAAGCLEFFVGLMLVFGFQTRLAAFLLSGEMAIGYFQHHIERNFFPALNGGEGAILFCFIFLYFVFSGPGAWSVDGRLANRA